jgi:hypothetical protein
MTNLKSLSTGTNVRILGRPEFGQGTITNVLGPNQYGVTFPNFPIPVTTRGVKISDFTGREVPNLIVISA